MTRLSKIVAFALYLLMVSVGPSYCGEIEVHLLCDKSTYLIGEDIWVDILVLNHDDDTIAVPLPCPDMGSFFFTVVGNNGDTLPYMGGQSSMAYLPTYDLAKGDTLYSLYNLTEGFSRSRGPVTVSAHYWEWRESNVLNIEVVPPTGEEAAALDLLREASWGPFTDSVAALYKAILDRYPNSVYAPTACHALSGMYSYHYNDGITAGQFSLLALERYPSSGWARLGIAAFLAGTRGEDRAAKLNSLRTADKPFRLRMLVRNAIKRIQTM